MGLVKVLFAVLAAILVLGISNNGPIHQVNAKVLKANNASAVFSPWRYTPVPVGRYHKRLINGHQIFLRISNDKINGSTTCSDPYVPVEIENFRMGQLKFGRIKGIRSGKYLAMNINGDLYPSTNPNDAEVIFRITRPNYQYISSHDYYRKTLYDTYVGIKRNGKALNGWKTKKNKNTRFFIIAPSRC
ncbi:uncharacterized protein LOC116291263 [Actinia tenebrosa]|uniref:Uncharacterized protein LOC116291263 n=1 Tax=Actinia tenebrosa TaxID=6105 RepID=A0A6P8HH42_ACTTE|nr:uncharacterized protein LOC116291263 [Actinia tenebrosa]